MPDFLKNLVARTLNTAPVVQPRITSRFEPVGASAPVGPDQSVEVDAPRQPEPPRLTTTTNVVETNVADPKPKPIVIPPTQQQVINTVRNTYVESHEVVQVPIIERVHERTHTETRIHTEKSTDSRLEIRENQTLLTPPREVEKNPLNQRLNIVEPAPVAKEAAVPTPQPPIVPRVVTRIEPAPVAQVPRFEVPPVVQPEPTETINVTIGRVDVRAVFSSQAPKAPVRSSSTTSLDDYLKQRSEGRR